MSMALERTLFVTGASGHLGRRVVELLLERGTGKIVAGTRKPEKLADLAARGVVIRQADFENPQGLTAALAGVDSVLIISTDAIDRPGRRLALRPRLALGRLTTPRHRLGCPAGGFAALGGPGFCRF